MAAVHRMPSAAVEKPGSSKVFPALPSSKSRLVQVARPPPQLRPSIPGRAAVRQAFADLGLVGWRCGVQGASVQHFALDDSFDPGLLRRKPPPFKKLRRNTGQKIKNRLSKDDFTHCGCHVVQQALASPPSSNSSGRARRMSAAPPRPLGQAVPPREVSSKGGPAPGQAGSEPSLELCGEDCLNRVVKVECSDWTCRVGPEQCRNRPFTGRRQPRTEPFRTLLKGWGLRAIDEFQAGDFIIEYVGEVIDKETVIERMARQHRELLQKAQKAPPAEKMFKVRPELFGHGSPAGQPGSKRRRRAPGDEIGEDDDESDPDGEGGQPGSGGGGLVIQGANYYFMTVGDKVVDAQLAGSDARFCNHSCDPNACVELWSVKDELRVGIFAQRQIKAGEEITIDYRYDKIKNVRRQPCYCGAKNCSKWIGSKPGGNADSDDEDSGRRQAKKRKLAFDSDLCDSACAHCGLEGGEVIMCDGRIGAEPCYRIHHLKCLGISTVPRGKWLCPYHFCNDCGRQCTNLCAHCSASWCNQHLPSKARSAKPPPARYDVANALGKVKVEGWIVCPQCVDEGPLIC